MENETYGKHVVRFDVTVVEGVIVFVVIVISFFSSNFLINYLVHEYVVLKDGT